MRVAPTQDTHLVRMRDMIEYVNALTTEAVRAIATEQINIASVNLPLIFDGVVLKNGDRLLVAGQLDRTQNGVYIMDEANERLVRADNFNTPSNITNGLIIPVLEGGSYGMTRWRTVLGGTPFVVGAINIEFQQEVVDLTRIVEGIFEIEGDDDSLVYDFTHGWGTMHVTHELYDTDGNTVVAEFKRISINNVRVSFGVPLGDGNGLTLVLKAEVEPL